MPLLEFDEQAWSKRYLRIASMRQHDMGGNPRPLTYNEVSTYLQFYPHPDPAFVAELTLAIDRRVLPEAVKKEPKED